ncbi:MAG: M16 family metallopeptidase [Gaiellaceae bacterium]
MSVFERTTLPNGIRVISAPMTHVQSTACYVMLHTGSRFETAETNGVAHFVEHMLFCGTPRRPSVRALTGEVDAIGGLFNANTSKEATLYYVKCASEYGPQALDVLADMLRNSLFDEGEIDREKKVIVEEMRAKFDTPRDYVDENLERLLYGDTTLGRLTIGSEETVTAASRDTLLDFVRRHYEPTRMVVGLAGRVDDSLVDTVNDVLGDLGPADGEATQPSPPAEDGRRVLLESKPIDQAHICIALRAYPLAHPDRYVVQILSTVLGGGMSSRLTEEVTMRRGLAYSVYTVSHGHTDSGAVWAQGGVNVDKVDEAITTIVDEMKRLADEPVGDEELAKARNYAKGRFVFSVETPQGIIARALRSEVLEGSPREPDEVIAGLDAVTANDIQRVAQDLLSRGLYLSVIGPYDDPDRFERLIT